MEPETALNRGYWEDSGKVRDQWINASKEIARKHWQLRDETKKMVERIKLACSLLVTHAVSYDFSRVDDCFYAEAVARANEFYENTENARKSLDGDFPCGNEDDMRFARRFFSNREMAFIQLGLANEVDPDDLWHVPPLDKPFADEAFPREYTVDDQPKGRKGFLHECQGHYAEAIECYEAMGKNKPDDRIRQLREKMACPRPTKSS